MMTAYAALFLALWLTAIRTEIVRRRVMNLRARKAMEA
jgi:heme exporter protein C